MIGIYCIKNLINGKRYIGQSSQLEYRMKTLYRNDHLNASIRKYGKDNFKIFVLKECQLEELDEYERYFISLYDTVDPMKGYNKESGGNSYKKATLETRKRLSESHLGKSSRGSGFTLPQSTKDKISCSLKGVKLSSATKEKMGKSRIRNSNALDKRYVFKLINDGKIVKYVHVSNIESFLKDNPDYSLGCGPRKLPRYSE